MIVLASPLFWGCIFASSVALMFACFYGAEHWRYPTIWKMCCGVAAAWVVPSFGFLNTTLEAYRNTNLPATFIAQNVFEPFLFFLLSTVVGVLVYAGIIYGPRLRKLFHRWRGKACLLA